MSTQAIGGAVATEPSPVMAAAQRVQQLQALIAQARTAVQQAPGDAVASNANALAQGASDTSFAAALDAASQPNAPGAAQAPAGSAGGAAYASLIDRAAARYNLDPALLHGLIQQESNFDPNARSSAGALGLTQLMPATAASLGVANPLDPAESVEGGARYLSEMMSQFGGNPTDALAAYNAGPGAVQKYGGVPPYPETQSYVSKVLGYADAYRQSAGGMSATGVRR